MADKRDKKPVQDAGSAAGITLLATADLHYNIARSRASTEELAQRVCRTPADALVLIGDTAGADVTPLRECLRLFHGFVGLKLLVPGNHCLWCRPGEDSLTRYEQLLPAIAQEEGFVLLDHAPQVVKSVAIVGSVGWYDFSFREESLEVPMAFYQAKVAPGAANYFSEYRDIVEANRQELRPEHYEISTRWMDGQHVRLGMSDEEFTQRLAEKLRRQMEELAPRVERIVACVHHLPFEELVPRGRPAKWAFAAAFLGSKAFGEVLLAQPKVTHVLCAHSHWPSRHRIGHIDVINVGSTYVDKRLEALKL